MQNIQNILVPFITGGIIVSGVKYAATHLNNPKLAALIGAFPIGLFSIYFLNNIESIQYGKNYGIMCFILLSSVIIFNILLNIVKLAKPISHFLSILFYFLAAAFHYLT